MVRSISYETFIRSFQFNPLVTDLANIVPKGTMMYLPLKQWKFYLALPFTLGPILAYMVFANLKVFSHNVVNFQDILLKFSEELYYVLHLNFLSTCLIKCIERHRLATSRPHELQHEGLFRKSKKDMN